MRRCLHVAIETVDLRLLSISLECLDEHCAELEYAEFRMHAYHLFEVIPGDSDLL